jgi:uncharacterized membrane protein
LGFYLAQYKYCYASKIIMKKCLIIVIVFVFCGLFAVSFIFSWRLALSIGLIILGSLGFLEKIFKIKWGMSLTILFLVLFVALSVVQAIYSHYKERQASDLSLQVEKERFARIQLERQLAPRHLTKVDRWSIINAMSRFRGMTINIHRRGELEPYNFANEIAEALKASGLRVEVDGEIGMVTGVEYGVIWWARPDSPDIGATLSKLLTGLQIPNRGYYVQDLGSDAALRVGLKIPNLNSPD